MLISLRAYLALVLLAAAFPAQAQDGTEWTFSFTPYAWLMGATGSVTAKGQIVDVSAGFVDIVGKTDSLLAWMSNFEARKDKLGLYLDFVFTQLTASPGIAAQRNPFPGTTLSGTANAGVKSTLIVIDAGTAYEFAHWDGAALDGLIGVRYWHAVTDITMGVTASFNPPSNVFDRTASSAIARSGNVDWADPVVGLRLRHALAPHHQVQLRGDVGGFGVGSQFTWQAFAGYAYEFSSGPTSWAAVLGYRALGVNYVAGSGLDTRGIDMTLHGPVVGLTVRW